MSNWHGQISRIGINLQSPIPWSAFPAWGADVYTNRFGSPAHWAVDVLNASQYPPAKWMADLPSGNLVMSREFLQALGRYPGRNDEIWTYQCSLTGVEGRTNRLSCTIWAAELYRNSHRGLDQGARSGKVTVDYLRVNFSDGSYADYYVNSVLFDYINGWGGNAQTWKWSVDLSFGKLVMSATLSLTVAFGTESYHDTGDGVPATWTPTGILGSAALGVGYDFAIPADPGTGWIDRQNTYLVLNNPGYAQILGAYSSAGTAGYTGKVGSSTPPPPVGGGGGDYLLIDPPAQGQTVAAKVDTVSPGYRGKVRFKSAATYNAPNTSSYALDFGATFVEVDGAGSILRGCGGKGGNGGGANGSPTAGGAGGPAGHKRGTPTVIGFTAYGGGGGGGGGAGRTQSHSYGDFTSGGGGGGGGQSGVTVSGGAGGTASSSGSGTGTPGSAGGSGTASGPGAGGAAGGNATPGSAGGGWGGGAAWN